MLNFKLILTSTMDYLTLTLVMTLTLVAGDIPPTPIELQYSVQEEVPVGTLIANIMSDARLNVKYESDVSSQLRFRFLSPPHANLEVDGRTGVLRTSGEIDRDVICPQAAECLVKMDVAVQPVQFFQIIKVAVVIEDINDNAPEFSEKGQIHRISEAASAGTSFILPSAVDNDSPDYSIQRYEIDSPTDKFHLDVREKVDGSTDAKLILRGKLDRELEQEYRVKVIAYDGGNPEKSGSVNVLITILDANDNDPLFKNTTYEVEVVENIAEGSPIVHVEAEDPDEGRNGQVIYSFSPRTRDSFGHLFYINNVTGEITTRAELDYERNEVYHLTVNAQDQGVDSVPTDAIVIVKLIDINDHAPDITVNTLTESGTDVATIAEDAVLGTFVAHITVVDKDSGKNAVFNCSLNDNHFSLVQVYPTEYQIQTASILDRERQSQYNLALMCKDSGKEPQVSVKHLQVMVADQNDNTPSFSQPSYYASLIENNYRGKVLVQVNATDKDTGPNADIQYSLPDEVKGLFQVDPQTGVITAASSIDREQMPDVRFAVIAKDHGNPARSSSAIVSISVEDVNDEKPNFSQHSYSFGVLENKPANTEVGVVQAKDLDEPPNNDVSYAIMPSRSDMDSFSINPNTGQIFTTKSLDREEETVYYLVIVASDSGLQALTSTVSVSIYVADKNDNDPQFVFPSRFNNTVYLSNQVPIGYAATRVHCSDADIGNNARMSYHITNGNLGGVFSMDPNNGVLTTNVELKDIENQAYELTVTATDHGDPIRRSQAILNIHVNKSLPYLHGEDAMLSGHNFTIVVSLACASGIITVVLVIAIVCIRRQDRNRSTHKYNCRAAEALKILSTSTQNQQHGEKESSATNGDAGRSKKEVSFSLEIDDPIKRPSSQQSWPSTIEHNYPPTPQAHSSVLTTTMNQAASPPLAEGPRYFPSSRSNALNGSSFHPPPLPGPFPNPHNMAWNLSHKELEVHQLLELLKRDGSSSNGGGGGDTDSAYSGDGSNTDSGRGPSEEGNTDAAATQHNGGHRSHEHPQMVIPGTIPEESFGGNTQVVPDVHNHSYGNQTTSFFNNSTDANYASTPDMTNPFRKMIDTAYGPTDIYTAKQTVRPNGTNTGPRVKFAEVPTTVRYETPHNNHGYHSYLDNSHDNTGGSDTSSLTESTEAAQYSCADMTVTLKTPSSGRGMGCTGRDNAYDDDDATTTTSGSYVVDPDDLCNEIDDLFFKDMVTNQTGNKCSL